ncbi:MAG: dienelactone hydrolase family protein [Acidobacteriia bacterium]|nr:dienelactone hydrolase family protein [Terriglobia bacterium]
MKTASRSRLAGILFFFATAVSFLLAPRDLAAAPPTGILFRSAAVEGVSYRYEVYVPEDWTAAKAWPVILFLHGIGHRGVYPPNSSESVLAKLFLGYQKSPQAIIVFPRCPEDATWIEPRMEKLELTALDQSIKEFHGDPSRVYLTGLSMGGYGTWYLASRNPGRFAALAPICGGVSIPKSVPLPAVSSAADPYADVAARIGRIPVWIFHGGADQLIDVTESRHMAAALRAAGAEVRYTEYPGVGHNSWDRAYSNPRLLPWLLSKSLRKPAKKQTESRN